MKIKSQNFFPDPSTERLWKFKIYQILFRISRYPFLHSWSVLRPLYFFGIFHKVDLWAKRSKNQFSNISVTFLSDSDTGKNISWWNIAFADPMDRGIAFPSKFPIRNAYFREDMKRFLQAMFFVKNEKLLSDNLRRFVHRHFRHRLVLRGRRTGQVVP